MQATYPILRFSYIIILVLWQNSHYFIDFKFNYTIYMACYDEFCKRLTEPKKQTMFESSYQLSVHINLGHPNAHTIP
jgi:hypothetical protein